MKNKLNILLSLALNLLILTACGGSDSGGTTNSSITVLPYCETITTYAGGITITGSAQYEYRTNGNGAVAAPKPIRHAEVRVLSTSGTIIQCGTTDATGNFSITLPNDSSVANVFVTSRANNTFLKVDVLNNPTRNEFHKIGISTILDGSKSIGTLTASATGTLEGGAFNILDKILDANNFLRTQTNNCSATFTECTPFTVAPLVTAYWSAGVNPGSYFGGGVVSFYIPTDRQLYIIGGVNGDINSSDTDHFDDSIILHEYGHFLEDVYSKTNSPGGSHNGNTVLDPRLAWGEGWANYFQAAVTGNAVYRDTSGTPEGTPSVFFNENLESGTSDTPTVNDQGNFREFAITRALWDITDANNEGANDTVTAPFSEFWTVFTSSNIGFSQSSLNFRNIGLFYKLQSTLTGKTNWSSVQTAEKQRSDEKDYSNTLVLGGGCGATTIQAANISGSQIENGTPANSNQFSSNDFYQYTHSGGSFTMTMPYTTTGGNPADLDLYLYSNNYTFGSASSVLGSSVSVINVGQNSGSETINISSLAAGTYMINVNVFTQARLGSAANYTMTINGQAACPTAL